MLAAYDSLEAGGRAVTDIIARRHRARRDRDDGRAVHRGGRGRGALRLPGGRGRGAARRARRARRRGRGGAGDRPRASARRRARARSGRPTTRRSGPGSGPAASPRSPPSGACPPPTSCRTAWCRAPRSATCSPGSAQLSAETGHPGGERVPRRRREPAPAGAVQRRRAAARRSGPRWCPARSSTRASSTAGRSPASTASGWTSPGTCRRCSAAADLDTMQLVRCAFDPASLCNPGKIFPTPRLCGEVPGHRRGPRPAAAARRGDLLMHSSGTATRSRTAVRARRRCDRGVRGRDREGAALAVCGDADARRAGRRGWCPRSWRCPRSTEEAAAVMRVAAEHELAVVAARRRVAAWLGHPAVAVRRAHRHVADGRGGRARGRRPGGPGAGRARGWATSRRCSRGPGRRSRSTCPAGATVGGVVASGLAGPRRLRYGTPRDLLIGITIVRADGTVAQVGREGRQERRRLRPRQAVRRVGGDARADHRGDVPAAPAARRAGVRDRRVRRRLRPRCDAVAAAANSPLSPPPWS